MSTEQGANGDSSPQSNAQQMVPKERLDELIAQRAQLERENQTMAALLRTAVPPSRPHGPPPEEPAHLKQLREENPAAYQDHLRTQGELKRQRAATFQILDKQDQMEFLQEFGGKGGRELLPLVNQKLEECRRNGNHSLNRGQIFLLLKGHEATIKNSKGDPEYTAAPTAPAAAKAQPSAQPFPGQDPSAGAAITSSSATSRESSKETLDELEKRLEDVEF